MDYIQNTPSDTADMLQRIGVASIGELFNSIPSDLRLNRPLALPPALPEQDLLAHLQSLAARNRTFDAGRCFLGAGAYNHFVPAVVDALFSRGEFLSSYTPYQAEASQGTLQHIFEFQSMMCELTGMDVANASHYDGATALQEAVAMSIDHTERKKVVISSGVNPQYRAVVRSLFKQLGATIIEVAHVRGITPVSTLKDAAEGAACIVVQNPNFLGGIEDLAGVAEAAHAVGALAVASVNPMSLALLKPPGECGCDIAVGEAQPLGIEMGFGGPWCGFIAAKNQYIRAMPGRIVGQTVDAEGKRGFVLTLQAREQHIRREKASSNICTNQALMALRATIYLETLGPGGLRRVAELSVRRAHELAEKLAKIENVYVAYKAPYFHEMVIELPHPQQTLDRLLEKGFLGGLYLQPYYRDLRDHVLMCCTERNTSADIDAFVAAFREVNK
jgi:glycine cleavage system P protein (glycine dehydrogenase) subunit 1